MRSTMILRTGSSKPEGPGASASACRSCCVSSPEGVGRDWANPVEVASKRNKAKNLMAQECYTVDDLAAIENVNSIDGSEPLENQVGSQSEASLYLIRVYPC